MLVPELKPVGEVVFVAGRLVDRSLTLMFQLLEALFSRKGNNPPAKLVLFWVLVMAGAFLATFSIIGNITTMLQWNLWMRAGVGFLGYVYAGIRCLHRRHQIQEGLTFAMTSYDVNLYVFGGILAGILMPLFVSR